MADSKETVVVSGEIKKIDSARKEGAKLTGKCKWFHYQKGFGFIDGVSDGGSEVFVHNTSIQPFEDSTPCLATGMEVAFVFTIDSDGRPRAKDVTRVDGSPIRVHTSQRNSGFLARLAEDPELKLGWCKWYNPAKGFGFITPENPSDPEVFLHKGNVEFQDDSTKTIIADQELEYKVQKEADSDKVKAIQVTAPGGKPVGQPYGGIPAALAGAMTQRQMMAAAGAGLLPVGGQMMLGKRNASTALLGYGGGSQAKAAQRMANGGGVMRIMSAGGGLLSNQSMQGMMAMANNPYSMGMGGMGRR